MLCTEQVVSAEWNPFDGKEMPICGTEMKEIGDIMTALKSKFVKEGDKRYLENREYTSKLFQCPLCKTVRLSD